MIKKILIVLGLCFVLLIGGFIALLMWAQKAGAELQDKFFAAVVTADPEQVLKLCDPALRKEIDAPVLGAWLNEVRATLGEYRGLSKSNFNTSMNTNDTGTTIESKGTVHFEKGDASSELKFQNNLVTAFSIDSDKLKGDWFKGPTDTKPYRERAEQFIRKFFAQDAAGAKALMGEALIKAVPDDKLKEFMAKIVGEFGPLKTATFREEKFTTEEGQALHVYYDLVGEKGKASGEVNFRFVGLKGHLNGFDFEPAKE